MRLSPLAALIPKAAFQEFHSPDLLYKTLEGSTELPTILLTNMYLSNSDGFGLLSWLKRHPKFHQIPVVCTTAEAQEETKARAKKAGVFDFLTRPLTQEQAENLLKRCAENSLDRAILEEMDRDFANELGEQVEGLYPLIDALREKSCVEIYRTFHTIKGCGGSLQFPHLAEFVHLAENLLASIRSGNLFQSAK